MAQKLNKYNQAIQMLSKWGDYLPNRLNHTVYSAMGRRGFCWDSRLKRWVYEPDDHDQPQYPDTNPGRVF